MLTPYVHAVHRSVWAHMPPFPTASSTAVIELRNQFCLNAEQMQWILENPPQSARRY